MQPVLDYLAANETRFLSELCDYLRFPSVSAQPKHKPDLEKCAAWIANHARAIGLEVEVCPTRGNPIVLARKRRRVGARKPHYVVYGHYDVQPPEPLELWKSPPFEPRIDGCNLVARGSCDNKGQHFAHLKAVEAYLKTGTELPCDLTFLIEGEEEIGCENLAPFLRARKKDLRCEAFVISDNGLPSKRHPALTYALRGIFAVEIRLDGPNRDLHSGLFGGAVDNPAMALAQMLAKLRDKNGRVAIPGFYDDVASLSKYERAMLAKLPGNEASFRKLVGVPELFGEKGFTSLERRTARPTCEINGLTSGYQGEGSKTIVPAWARAKLTFRLVPDMDPQKVQRLVVAHLKSLCPPSCKLTVEAGHAGEPYLVQPDSPRAQAALRALREAFGCEPVLMREGGSIPIVNDFKRILGVETLLLGLSLPDDNAHSPNEKFDLDCFRAGTRMSALLWRELAQVK